MSEAQASSQAAWETIAREDAHLSDFEICASLELQRRGGQWRVIVEQWRHGSIAPKDRHETEGRGTSPEAACAAVRSDVFAWCGEDKMAIAEYATKLRKLCYRVEDALAEWDPSRSTPVTPSP